MLGLLMSNLGVIPFEAPPYAMVNKTLLPLAIPMLLFSADLRFVPACRIDLLSATPAMIASGKIEGFTNDCNLDNICKASGLRFKMN